MIGTRIKYLLAESVYNRPSYFFFFISNSNFGDFFSQDERMICSNFDLILNTNNNAHLSSDKRKSITLKQIDEIISLELNPIGFSSNILNHKSIYNNIDISHEYINKLSKQLGHAYLYEHFFLWFEDYFKHYLLTMNTLMVRDAFIPKTWRFYIALMAASTMRSEYLYRTIEVAFLEVGGDEAWLIYGLDVIPEKLSKLSKINNLLAHQPWKIITEDIKELMNKRDQNDTTNWNLNEFMQAALIMVQYHKLAIIIDSLNVKLRCKGINSNKKRNSENSSNISPDDKNSKTSEIITGEKNSPLSLNNGIKDVLLKNLEILNIDESLKMNSSSEKAKEKLFFEEKESIINSFKDIDIIPSNQEEVEASMQADSKLECQSFDKTIDYDKHLNKYCKIYHDFDAHGDEFHSYLEFNWSDHGFYILKNLFPNGINCFNQENEYILGLTTNSLGDENRQLNTFPIRYAISCYIEKILGYVHEDYDYANVNKLLVVDYKKFIKNVACYPQRLSKEDFKMMNYAFNNEEILHIILLVATVKSRTQLTYLANNLNEFIKGID